MQDRRCIIRWQINRQARLKLEGAEAFVNCHIQDICFKGIKMVLGMKLQKDTFLKLRLCLSEDCMMDVEVWVAWHKTIDGHNLYGLYFTKIKDLDKEKIYKFMYKNFPQQLAKQWWKDFIIEEKGGEEMEDRRTFARFKAEFPLRFLEPRSGKEGEAKTSDISAKGVGLVTEEELTLRAPLELWLEIPDKGEPIYTRGEVVWQKKLPPNKYKVGVNLEKAELMELSRVLRIV